MPPPEAPPLLSYSFAKLTSTILFAEVTSTISSWGVEFTSSILAIINNHTRKVRWLDKGLSIWYIKTIKCIVIISKGNERGEYVYGAKNREPG